MQNKCLSKMSIASTIILNGEAMLGFVRRAVMNTLLKHKTTKYHDHQSKTNSHVSRIIRDSQTQQTTTSTMTFKVSISDDIKVHQVPRVESILLSSLFYQPDEIAHMRDEALHEQKFGFLDLTDSHNEDITPTVKRDALARERRPATPRARSDGALNTRRRAARVSKSEPKRRSASSISMKV
jgi:hypothetical protein